MNEKEQEKFESIIDIDETILDEQSIYLTAVENDLKIYDILPHDLVKEHGVGEVARLRINLDDPGTLVGGLVRQGSGGVHLSGGTDDQQDIRRLGFLPRLNPSPLRDFFSE